MSNQGNQKTVRKPLKGVGQFGSIGYVNADQIVAGSLVLESINIPGLIEDGILENVLIKNSSITNTIIGAEQANIGYFTELQTGSYAQGYTVKFYGEEFGDYVEWDPFTSTFAIYGGLNVRDCSQLGNIEICNNDIRAVNNNGNVNVISNNFGQIKLVGSVLHNSTTGNFESSVSNGAIDFRASDYVKFKSDYSTASLQAQGQLDLTTANGHIYLNTDTGARTAVISAITSVASGTRVTTRTVHNLKVGDQVQITSSNSVPSIDGTFAVASIVSPTQFTIAYAITTAGNQGSVTKPLNNDVYINATRNINVPSDIPVNFGTTENAVSGNTSGLLVRSTRDIAFSVPTARTVSFPENVDLKLGSACKLVNNSGASLDITAPETRVYGNVVMASQNVTVDSSNVKVKDPIITIGGLLPQVVGDNKDRGIEFYYNSSTTGTVSTSGSKLGWFGWKNNAKVFSFIPEATNTGEVISGEVGNMEANILYANQVLFRGAGVGITGGTMNLQCGDIINVSSLVGCSNELMIKGNNNVRINATTDITLTALGRIVLNSAGDVLVPTSIPLKFGESGTLIRETLNRNLVMQSYRDISLATGSGGSVIVPLSTLLSFDGTTTGTRSIVGTTAGTLVVKSTADIVLDTPTSVVIPRNTSIKLSQSAATETITGTSTGIAVTSANKVSVVAGSNAELVSTGGDVLLSALNGNIVLNPTQGTIRVPSDIRMHFGLTGTSNSVSSDSTGNLLISGKKEQALRISNVRDVDLLASRYVNVPYDTLVKFGDASSVSADTIGTLKLVNTAALGSTVLQSQETRVDTNVLSVTPTTVAGSVASIGSEHVRLSDPVITIGLNNSLDAASTKDRGIEFHYKTSATDGTKLGWFGWKRGVNALTFLPNAVNANEVITGAPGNAQFGTVFSDNVSFTTSGQLDMACGRIVNTKVLQGCSGDLRVIGSSSVSVEASTGIFLTAPDTFVPVGSSVRFGDVGRIRGTTAGNLELTANDSLVIYGNVQVRGETTSFFSTVTNLQDPIFSLGGVTGPLVSDHKDRGIEFKWTEGTSGSKVGFFGWKDSTHRFTFIPEGINTNEVFSGTAGDVEINSVYARGVVLDAGGQGQISGVKLLTGPSITVATTSGNIFLNPTSGSSVVLPADTKLSFGTTSNSVQYASSSGQLQVSSTSVAFNASSVFLPNSTPVYFGTAGTQVVTDASNDLYIINCSGSILLSPETQGYVHVPVNSAIIFDSPTNVNQPSTRNAVASDGQQLFLYGYQGTVLNSGTTTITGDVNIVGSLAVADLKTDKSDYIYPLGTYNNFEVTEISNYAATQILVRTSTAHGLVAGDIVTFRSTNSAPKIDGEATVLSVLSTTSFTISGQVTSNGTNGSGRTKLTSDPGKDVGIQVNWHTGSTIGTASAKFGFFGFKRALQRWVFIADGQNASDVFSGGYGDAQLNKLFAARLSGFILDGGITGGSNLISGTNFAIGGGSIEATPIGAVSPQTGRFSTLTSTVQSNVVNQTFTGNLNLSTERYTLSSAVPTRDPSRNVVVTFVTVSGVSFVATGTMPNGTIDGQSKTVIMSSIGTNCRYALSFPAGKLMMPNPLSGATPTKITFKRTGQSATFVWDNTGLFWVPTGGNGGYVE